MLYQEQSPKGGNSSSKSQQDNTVCGIQVVLLWKEEKKKVGGKLLTSANIKKDIPTLQVWCAQRGGEARGGRGSGERQLTHPGARLARSRSVGNRVR